ncbi:hypothetical protein JMY91_06105 [Brenneria goodwinii]|nr:hypothetical protein [Brenneria goodwinii]
MASAPVITAAPNSPKAHISGRKMLLWLWTAAENAASGGPKSGGQEWPP